MRTFPQAGQVLTISTARRITSGGPLKYQTDEAGLGRGGMGGPLPLPAYRALHFALTVPSEQCCRFLQRNIQADCEGNAYGCPC